jgi:type II secretory pathway component GspD/PulD (secretin)
MLSLLIGQVVAVQAASEKTPLLISLDVREMDLQDVLRLIAEKANVNIILSRGVAETDVVVTLRLKNVDLWQALEAVLEVSGFTYREEEGIIRVGKREELLEDKLPLVTEIILLKYVKAQEIKEICQHFLSFSGTIKTDVHSKVLIITDTLENIEKISQVAIKLDTKPPLVLEKKRFQLNYIDIEEKKDILKEVLNNIIEEGEFFLDSLSNCVYVEAPSPYIKRVTEYLEKLDVRPKRIMIKAEFVEVRLTDEEELGIKWRWKGAYDNYPLGATFRYPHQTRSESGQSAANPGLSTLAAGMGIIFGSAGQEFRGIIDLLISEGKANLLSSPNIASLEGQEAKIDVGDEYPYETYVIEGGVKVPTIKFKTVGATLLVTPYIKGEKEVVLDIESEVSEITGAPPFPTAPPIVGTRKARTQIAVDDGATIVIGGLLRETEKETREGIPFLSRLPLLGSLFTYKTTKKEKTDLLVFITPYILPEELEEENIVEKIKPLKVQIEELYQKGLDYKKLGDYEKAQECLEETAEKSRTYGFSSYLESIEKELLELERLKKEKVEEEEKKEKAKLEKEKREKAKLEEERIKKAGLEKKETEKGPVLALALGQWFPSKDNNSFMIYEAQFRLKGSLRLFGGGGKSSEESSYIGYFGVRIGDRLNIGVGGINSSALEKTELMLSAGFSLGTERVRLEGNYFYVTENEDVSGIRAALGIRF